MTKLRSKPWFPKRQKSVTTFKQGHDQVLMSPFVLNKSYLDLFFRQFDFLCTLGKDSIPSLVWNPWKWKDQILNIKNILNIRHTVVFCCPLLSTSRLCLGMKEGEDWLDLSCSTWVWRPVGTHAAVLGMRVSNAMKTRAAGTCHDLPRVMWPDKLSDPTAPAEAWSVMLWSRRKEKVSNKLWINPAWMWEVPVVHWEESWRQIWALWRLESKTVCNHPFLLCFEILPGLKSIRPKLLF